MLAVFVLVMFVTLQCDTDCVLTAHLSQQHSGGESGVERTIGETKVYLSTTRCFLCFGNEASRDRYVGRSVGRLVDRF